MRTPFTWRIPGMEVDNARLTSRTENDITTTTSSGVIKYNVLKE